jgi:hypothetical protein
MPSTVYLPKTKLYHHSRQWNLSELWELSESFEIKSMPVSELWDKRYHAVWCWRQEYEEINNQFFLHHMQRVLSADLNYPIILSEENYIFDGVHRLMKCKHLNIKHINYRKFTKDPTSKLIKPELDFLQKLKESRKNNNELH